MRVLRKLWLGLVILGGILRRRERPERIVEEGEPNHRAERTVIFLLLAAAACGVMFVVIYALDLRNSTQYLGLALGLCLALISAAMIVAANGLVVTEQLAEEYAETRDPEAEENVVQTVTESADGISRKKFLAGAAGAAGLGLGAAVAAPIASLGPVLDTESLYDSPWRGGRPLADETNHPYRAEDIEAGSFYTAYPLDASHEELGSPVVVVRVSPDKLDLPPERRRWAPDGIVAYSKICTHAGCAISLYRTPLFAPAEPAPMLVCPCHYSTFDPATGGTVTFGPAGRELPQLPLEIDDKGGLRAAADFSGPVGPSFWGVRTRRPS
jgi:ubiquinol-cytochrome c reductase iron-sulfur subunit